ncbi:ec16 protein [Colletotrichum incanum]|nr:ec16 protein [Colletotrichum incanum]
MRFSLIAVLTLAAATQEAFASSVICTTLSEKQCRIADVKDNCCWGGSNGRDACLRQRGGANVCRSPNMAWNFCRNVYKQGTQTPVSETCDADCCDTVTGWGIGCPK